MERWKDRKVAWLGVDTDEGEPAALARRLSAAGVTWRNFLDGSTDGPFTRTLGIGGFPSLFVIDAAGVLRSDPNGDEDVEALVERLLAELDAR